MSLYWFVMFSFIAKNVFLVMAKVLRIPFLGGWNDIYLKKFSIVVKYTVCASSSAPFYLVTYYIKRGTTSWTDSSWAATRFEDLQPVKAHIWMLSAK